MPALRIRPEYGPTLARELAPRWRASSRGARVALLAGCTALLALLIALALTLLNAHYSHGGRVPFSFSYRGLYRSAPEAGAYVRVERRGSGGELEYSFGVGPLQLPPYHGEVTGELPLYATVYERALARRYPDFELRSEGKTRINNQLLGYQVTYTAAVEGQEMYARNVLVVPESTGAREGVTIAMLTAPGVSAQVDSPLEVATTGILLRPLKTFALR